MTLRVTFRTGDAEAVHSIFGDCKDTKVTSRMEIEGFYGKKFHVAVSHKKPFFFSSHYQRCEVYNLKTQKNEYVWIDKNSLKHRFSANRHAVAEVLDVVLHNEAEKAKKLNPALVLPKLEDSTSNISVDSHAAEVQDVGLPGEAEKAKKLNLLPKLDDSTSSSTSAEPSQVSSTSSEVSIASLGSRISLEVPAPALKVEIPEIVKNAFAAIPNKLGKGQGTVDSQREKIHRVFKQAKPVVEPTLLDRRANKIARDILQGPKEEGYVLMDLEEEGDLPIAHGGFKRLYHAVGLHDGGDYVIAECDIADTMHKHEWTQAKVRKTLLREMDFTKMVKGAPNVVDTVIVHEANGKFYFIMKRHSGSLSKLLKDLRAGKIKMTLKEKMQLGRDLIQGVAALHKIGLIHRDIKPGNILIDENRRAAFTDFGLSTKKDDTSPEGVSRVCGTPSYYAPELVNDEPSTPAVDLWDLGIVLYNLFTEEPMPWEVDSEDSNPGSIPNEETWKPKFRNRESIPRPVRTVIQGLMRVNPKDRLDAESALEKWDKLMERSA